MPLENWRVRISEALGRVGTLSGNTGSRLKRILGLGDPIKIIPYLGYGNADLSTDTVTALNNLENMYHRFDTDEIRNAHVRAKFRGITMEVRPNDEGYQEKKKKV
ncbi:MAG: hypothetical protein AB1489_40765 [Acidobacteriota bacterium]